MTDSSDTKKQDNSNGEITFTPRTKEEQESYSLGEESGANLAEYAILLALLLCIALIAIQNVGKEVSSVYSGNARAMSEAFN